MFRKPDDALFARIFDDGEPGDTRMEWLRDGLKDLREVPPHGLSNDRLRDRLLGNSLAPAAPKSAPWWSWAWAPVAAAAIAVVILPRFRSTPAPTVILNPGPVLADGQRSGGLGGRSSFDDRVALNRPMTRTADPMSTKTIDTDEELALAMLTPDDVSESGRPIRRLVGSSGARRSGVPVSPDKGASRPLLFPNAHLAITTGSTPGTLKASARDEDAQATLVSDMALEISAKTAAVLPAPPNEPLVLLAPEIDVHTGAVAATEVDSPANLSIGG